MIIKPDICELLPIGFRLRLQGGETKPQRDQALKAGLAHARGQGEFPLDLTTTAMVWYKKDQHNARSCKYILLAHQGGVKWVMTIAHVHQRKTGVIGAELRAFHPQEVPCRRKQIPSSAVPVDVMDAVGLIFNIIKPTAAEARMDILFDD